MIPIVSGAIAIVVLTALSVAIGRLILQMVGARSSEPAGDMLLSCGLGLGALQFVPFALFSIGAGRPAVFRITCAVLAPVLAPSFLRAARDLRVMLQSARSKPWPEGFFIWILGAVVAVTFLRAVCPPTDDDGLSYHLSAALRPLAAGRFIYLPTLTYTNWPTGVEMLFALIKGVYEGFPPGTIQFMFGALSIGATYLIAKRLGGPSAGVLAAALLLTYGVFWEEMAQCHVDLGTTLFASLAIYSLVCSAENANASRRRYDLAALFSGLCVTTKLNGVWIAAAIALVLFLNTERNAEQEPSISDQAAEPTPNPSNRFWIVLRFLAIAAVVCLPWFIKTWILTGNPVYPLA